MDSNEIISELETKILQPLSMAIYIYWVYISQGLWDHRANVISTQSHPWRGVNNANCA